MSFSKEAAVGFFVMLGLVCVAYLTVKLGRMEVFHSEGYVLTASFNSVSGLRPGAGGRDRRRPRRAGQVHPAG